MVSERLTGFAGLALAESLDYTAVSIAWAILRPGGSTAMGRQQGNDSDAIIEFQRVGNVVKVSAVDTRTFVEVSIMAPANATEEQMTETVMRKLAWVQSKDRPKGATKTPGRTT